MDDDVKLLDSSIEMAISALRDGDYESLSWMLEAIRLDAERVSSRLQGERWHLTAPYRYKLPNSTSN